MDDFVAAADPAGLDESQASIKMDPEDSPPFLPESFPFSPGSQPEEDTDAQDP